MASKNAKFANPLAALGGTFVSPGHNSPALFGKFVELSMDPEIADEEERVRVGKRRTRTTPERFFVPAPRKGREDTRVAKFPRKGTCHCLPSVVAVEPSFVNDDPTQPCYGTTGNAERLGPVDDGLTIEERIATLLEMRPSMVYAVFDTAVRQRRETILEALVNSVFHLTTETRQKVARQVRHFPTNSPFTARLSAALAL